MVQANRKATVTQISNLRTHNMATLEADGLQQQTVSTPVSLGTDSGHRLTQTKQPGEAWCMHVCVKGWLSRIFSLAHKHACAIMRIKIRSR